MSEGTLRERFSDNLGKVEVMIYAILAVLLALTAIVTIVSAGKMLWDGLRNLAGISSLCVERRFGRSLRIQSAQMSH